MGRLLRVLLVLVIAVVVIGGGRWYLYVTNTESPYDEVGIELNSRMPEAIRSWGCARLRANFPAAAVPPMGCARLGAPTQWLGT